MSSENSTENNATESGAEGSGSTETASPASNDFEKLVKEQTDKYLYLYAEFENYKKRAIKERSEQLKFGHENFARDLLQVVDNLERALQHTTNQDSLVAGIKLVHQNLLDTLTRYGVTAIKTKDQKFDPTLHEALANQEVAEEQVGCVIEEQQKGYTLHGRLLRPSKVLVGISKQS